MDDGMVWYGILGMGFWNRGNSDCTAILDG